MNLEATEAQLDTLERLNERLDHATQPAGPHSTLYIYDAEEFYMELLTIEPDGTFIREQRAFDPHFGWEVVE
jgi:hypothetical protein